MKNHHKQVHLTHNTSTSNPHNEPLIVDLQERCNTLLAELDAFKAHLESNHREHEVELRSLRGAVQSEAKALAKLVEAFPEQERINHTLRSSNLPFFEAVWSTAKRSTGVVAFSKRFYWDAVPRDPANRLARNVKPTARKSKKYSALVDVVAQNGAEWIKGSSMCHSARRPRAESGSCRARTVACMWIRGKSRLPNLGARRRRKHFRIRRGLRRRFRLGLRGSSQGSSTLGRFPRRR